MCVCVCVCVHMMYLLHVFIFTTLQPVLILSEGKSLLPVGYYVMVCVVCLHILHALQFPVFPQAKLKLGSGNANVTSMCHILCTVSLPSISQIFFLAMSIQHDCCVKVLPVSLHPINPVGSIPVDQLNRLRTYIDLHRSLQYRLPDQIQHFLEQDFVDMRKESADKMNADVFHQMLCMARLDWVLLWWPLQCTVETRYKEISYSKFLDIVN